MKRSNWLDRLFSLSLYLYPRDFRQQFGEEMRDVFHQQCQRQQNRLRLIGELLLDNLRAVPAEHGRLFAQHGIARLHLLMVLLCMALAGLMLRPQVSAALSDAFDGTSKALQGLAYQRFERLWSATGNRLSERARQTLLNGTEEQRLMMALLFSREQASRAGTPEQGPRFWVLNGKIPVAEVAEAGREGASSVDPIQLQVAALICAQSSGCDATQVIDRLTQIDAGNAASWMLAADLLAKDHPEQARHALEQALHAGHYLSFHRQALASWYESVWVERTQAAWWWPEEENSLDSIIFAEFQFKAVPILRSCRGTPVDAALCQQVAERWQDSADDFYTALWMQRSAQGYAEWHPKTPLDDLYWSFANTAEANANEPNFQPEAMAARIREVGSLTMMQEVVAQSTDLNSTENLH